jgi:hypothetical protein
VRFTARQTAIAALAGLPLWADRKYNVEVLPDPEKAGFLVYALASPKVEDEIVVGGHLRLSVSADGKTVTQIDHLSKSLLTLRKDDPALPAKAKTTGYTVSHVVSKTPVETHVFLSLQNEKPFFVTTSDKKEIWIVYEGEIKKAEPREPGK